MDDSLYVFRCVGIDAQFCLMLNFVFNYWSSFYLVGINKYVYEQFLKFGIVYFWWIHKLVESYIFLVDLSLCTKEVLQVSAGKV